MSCLISIDVLLQLKSVFSLKCLFASHSSGVIDFPSSLDFTLGYLCVTPFCRNTVQ